MCRTFTLRVVIDKVGGTKIVNKSFFRAGHELTMGSAKTAGEKPVSHAKCY